MLSVDFLVGDIWFQLGELRLLSVGESSERGRGWGRLDVVFGGDEPGVPFAMRNGCTGSDDISIELVWLILALDGGLGRLRHQRAKEAISTAAAVAVMENRRARARNANDLPASCLLSLEGACVCVCACFSFVAKLCVYKRREARFWFATGSLGNERWELNKERRRVEGKGGGGTRDVRMFAGLTLLSSGCQIKKKKKHKKMDDEEEKEERKNSVASELKSTRSQIRDTKRRPLWRDPGSSSSSREGGGRFIWLVGRVQGKPQNAQAVGQP